MLTALSRLAFRRGVFRLFEERNIPASEVYWIQVLPSSSSSSISLMSQFWSLPETAEDVFSLISPTDIRRVRDSAPENLETLLTVVTSRLFALRHHPAFPENELAPAKEALNCMRVLTRLFPFIFETDDLGSWQERFWWTKRKVPRRHGDGGAATPSTAQEDTDVIFEGEGQKEGDIPLRRAPMSRHSSEELVDGKPLAEELLDTLLDFLSFAGFTVPAKNVQHNEPKVTMSIW